MSKERAKARAAREAEAAKRSAEHAARLERTKVKRERAARRDLVWRRNRLWSHGTSFHRNRERWAAMVCGIFLAMLLGYLFTGSFRGVLVMAVLAVFVAPAAYTVIFRSEKR